MKILYLSDDYTKNVAGTKISIFNELKRRGLDITFGNVHSHGHNRIDGSDLCRKIKKFGYDHILIGHTWVEYSGCTLLDINRLGAKVHGFGFSDPYDWDGGKLKQYNSYATNHLGTYNRLSKDNIIPVIYFPTACDIGFHRRSDEKKPIDILIYGCGHHPRFDPVDYRVKVASMVLDAFKNKRIEVFGTKWGDVSNNGYIDGDRFLKCINKSKISIDLQQEIAPPAHRLFECMASGTLVITKKRPEVQKLLQNADNNLFYESFADLSNKIRFILNNDTARIKLEDRMYKYTRGNHNISNRIDILLPFLKGVQC